MPSAGIAMLMTQAGMSWRDIQDTPPRVLYIVLDYISKTGPYARKLVSKDNILEKSMPPGQFEAMVKAMQGSER